MRYLFIWSAIMAPILLAFSAQASDVRFPEGKTCAAWKAKKRMFLVRTLEPVGISCDVKVSWLGEGNESRILIVVPINTFDSGEAERDQEVVKILGGDAHPDIKITSEFLTTEVRSEFESGKTVTVKGEVELAGRKVEKPFLVVRDPAGLVARVQLQTKFQEFQIEPPTVAGGAVAKVHDVLELHAQILLPDGSRP